MGLNAGVIIPDSVNIHHFLLPKSEMQELQKSCQGPCLNAQLCSKPFKLDEF